MSKTVNKSGEERHPGPWSVEMVRDGLVLEERLCWSEEAIAETIREIAAEAESVGLAGTFRVEEVVLVPPLRTER